MRKNSKVLLILLSLLLCVSSLNGCKEEENTKLPETSVLLMGFESYEEVVGSKIAIGNMLGRMEINTDEAYITQGSGSLKVCPQGFYSQPEYHPYFKLDFLNSACATCDFSKFKNVSVDVYNPQDKELKISVNFFTGKSDGNFISTMEQTFTLKPNGWTTCAYDLSVMGGFTIYDFTSVRYMTVEFLDHKQSREDAVNELYFDNLQGNLYAEGESPVITEFNFHDGIDFETTGTELVFTGQGKADTDATIARVSYAELDIAPLENGGDHALRIGHTTFYWPTFRINFGKELPAGTEISFMAYGLIHGESLYNQSIFEFSSGGEATVQFKCGQWQKLTITLPANATYLDLFWNYDRAGITSGTVSGEVYIDNIIATDPIPPIEPEGNIWEGLNFEIPGNAGLFAGLKIEGAEKSDATIERVAYAELDIPILTDGGEYALKLSHDSFYWPTFRIYFGEKLPKGTIITFQAYARITDGTSNYNKSIFEYRDGLGEATNEFPCDQWTELKMELPADAEYIDLFWNYDRAQITSETASAEVYIDNLIATPGKEPIEPAGDFYKGLDFEIIGNVGYFVGQDIEKQDAVIDWVAYDDVKIPVPQKGGSHLMRLSHDSFYWPTFRVNFGKTLPAGTKLSFMAYGTIQGKNQYNVSIFEFSEGGEATVQFSCNQWTELTITLPKAADHIDLFWNFDRAGIVSSASGAVYIDNMIAKLPEKSEGNLLDGVGFEVKGNTYLFAPVGGENAWRDANFERVRYRDVNVTAPANGGEYALKITCQSSQWPVFRLNFGTTLKAGTTITFDAYTNDTSGIRTTVSIFEYVAGGEATAQYYHGAWNTLTITLASECDHIDLVCNMDRWNEDGPDNIEVYVDNFKAVEPVEAEGDFLEGVDFEIDGNTYLFVGQGKPGSDAAIERVSYGDVNVIAPANGGEYALKLSHESHCWPTFRIKFGKTLKAGTTITFDVYGNYDYEAPEGGYKYMKLELSSKDIAASEDPNQIVWTLVETWNIKAAITLTADSDYVDLMYNVADGQHGEVSSWLLLDNFKAVELTEPIEPEPTESEPTEPEPTESKPTEPEATEPAGDITEGVDFETEGSELWFGAVGGDNAWRDATVERVVFDGDYALKLTCESSQWPVFRLSFGKILKAGTTITFDAYTHDTSGIRTTVSIFEYVAGGEATVQYYHGAWNTLTITLASDCSYIDLMCNMDRWNEPGPANFEVYLDNFKAVEPAAADGGITDGLDFENADDILQITGIGANQDAAIERVSYADIKVAAPENGGSYALKVSHENQCWPTFRLNFGKTLKAGTTITFDFYGNYDYAAPVGAYKYVKLELAADSKSFATSEDPNQIVWTLVETWQTATVTLTADSDHIDFFYNVADGQHGNVASWILLDNVKATESSVAADDITGGLDFENADDILQFTGDTIVERVSYADANVTAPENGGDYALKLSHTNGCWPAFRLNFGKTLPAGTVITFDFYGNYDYVAATGVNKYMKLELAADSKSFATSEDPNQIVWTLVETWQTATVTLTADSDHIDFFYNVADGQHGEVSSWLLLDNFKASEPSAEKQLRLVKKPVLQVQAMACNAQNLWHKFFKVR